MERKDQIIQLRPKINYQKEMQHLELEEFQNTVLRPILKFQNPILHEVFRKQLTKYKIQWAHLDMTKKEIFFSSTFSTDLRFKNIYLGIILGLFTAEEFIFYSNNEKAINKRILSMLKERLRSSF